jgi:hypothetical protein
VTEPTKRVNLARRTVLGGVGSAALGLFTTAAMTENVRAQEAESEGVRLELLGRYESGLFDEGGAEIIDYHSPTERLFVINANLGGVDVLDVSDPTSPSKIDDIDVVGDLSGVSTANSVSVATDAVAVAIEAEVAQDRGKVAFYDPDTLSLLGSAEVGPLPDKVTFAPNGETVLIANEGEPNEAYDVDPRGSVSIVDIAEDISNPTVRTAGFTQYDGREDELRERDIRVFGPDASASQDFEPEYVSFSDDSSTAWVSLQENNAIAEIDVADGSISNLFALGFKNHSDPANPLDASNEDGGINIQNWPIYGMFQPDAIGAYTPNNETYVVTANEGDARDYDGYSEEAEVADIELDPEGFDVDDIENVDSVAELQDPENLGPKGITTTLGDTDDDGLYEDIYVYGGRSFSIFTTDGQLVFDSGDDLEQITADAFPDQFNNDNDESDPDGRSDNKGPEPEGLTIGEFGGRYYLFIGLERIGGIVTYDITDPEDPVFLDYINERDFSVDIQADIENGDAPAGAAGDLGPEGLAFASADESPVDNPVVFVGHEVSGTTTIFEVIEDNVPGDDPTAGLSPNLLRFDQEDTGDIGRDDVLNAIVAFNQNESVGGSSVSRNDILDVIVEYNAS